MADSVIKKTIEFDVKGLSEMEKYLKELNKLAKDPSFSKTLALIKEQNEALKAQAEIYKELNKEKEIDYKIEKDKNAQEEKKKQRLLKTLGKTFSGDFSGAIQEGGASGGLLVLITIANFIREKTAAISQEAIGISLSTKDLLKNVMSIASSVLDMKTGAATYDIGTSLVTNRAARNIELRYGLTGREAYAFSRTSSMLGMDVNSLEDLMYMNANQRELFVSLMDKYNIFYEKMNSTGAFEAIQELQMDVAIMKEELGMEFLSWIGENKELITEGIKGWFAIAKILTEILLVIGKIASGIGFGIGSLFSGLFGSSSKSSNVNINVTGTINGETNQTSNDYFSDLLGEAIQKADLGLGD